MAMMITWEGTSWQGKCKVSPSVDVSFSPDHKHTGQEARVGAPAEHEDDDDDDEDDCVDDEDDGDDHDHKHTEQK